jgi:selenocysteine lyase/cysteine desulfurase
MGEVYRARHTQLGREAAIKVLPTEYAAKADRLRRLSKRRAPPGGVRCCPHVYNTMKEIERTIAALRETSGR